MPATREDLCQYLDDLGTETKIFDHPPVFTVEESQTLRGEIAGGHSKNLFLKDKKGGLFLITANENTSINLKNLHGLIGAAGRVSFGKPELLMEVLGVIPGAVTPFAVINDTKNQVKMILDADLMENDPLNFHPLTNEATMQIGRDQLVKFLDACDHPPEIIPLNDQ